jgi:hypothetical protein
MWVPGETMSIAKSLPEIHPDFIQECPLCARMNRIVVQGLFVLGDKKERHPDMGYSFCNCKNIFYTRPENLRDEVSPYPNAEGLVTYPDPFFAWPDPYSFLYWDVRRYRILWNMDTLCDDLKSRGYGIISAERDFDVQSATPQHFHIKVSQCPA